MSILVREHILQSFSQFFALVDNDTVYPCKAHSGVSVDIVADQIHFHILSLLSPCGRTAGPCGQVRKYRRSVLFRKAGWDYRFPRIMKEMIRP